MAFGLGRNVFHKRTAGDAATRDSVIDKEHPPASTLAEVQALFREDIQVEIEAEAVIQSRLQTANYFSHHTAEV
jgi:hypothetical protein